MSWSQTTPCDHLRAFKSGLQDFVEPSTPLWSLLLNRHQAYEVYSLQLEKVGAGTPPETLNGLVSPRGWRFLTSNAGQSGACHVGSVAGSPKVTGFSSAPEIANVVAYIREIEVSEGISASDYEMRFLRIPWLRFEAFWLASKYANEDDIVIPYTRFARLAKLQPMTQYSVTDFLAAIWPLVPAVKAKKAAEDAKKARDQEKIFRLRSKVADTQAKRLQSLAEEQRGKADRLEAEERAYRSTTPPPGSGSEGAD